MNSHFKNIPGSIVEGICFLGSIVGKIIIFMISIATFYYTLVYKESLLAIAITDVKIEKSTKPQYIGNLYIGSDEVETPSVDIMVSNQSDRPVIVNRMNFHILDKKIDEACSEVPKERIMNVSDKVMLDSQKFPKLINSNGALLSNIVFDELHKINGYQNSQNYNICISLVYTNNKNFLKTVYLEVGHKIGNKVNFLDNKVKIIEIDEPNFVQKSINYLLVLGS